MRLRLTRRASAQFWETLDDLASQSPRGAASVSAHVSYVLGLLMQLPLAGRRTARRAVRSITIVPFPDDLDDHVDREEVVVIGNRHASRRPLPCAPSPLTDPGADDMTPADLRRPASRRPPQRHAPLMDRDQVLARLRDHAPALRRQGVVRAALFGSVARGEAGPDSDTMVELDPEIVRTLLDYVGVKLVIEDMFETAVDVVDRQGLKSGVRPQVPGDAIYAF